MSLPRSPLILPVFLASLLSGCVVLGPHQPFTYRKRNPVAIKPTAVLTYRYEPTDAADPKFFKTKYDGAENKVAERNAILFELMGLVDDHYYRYTVNLRDVVIGKNMVGELLGISTSFAAAMAGGEQVKSVLSAISTGVQTLNTAIDKEVFLDNSVQAIRFQMDANRAAIAANMADKMAAPGGIADYPLEAGLRDIVAYYDAGTVTCALASLAAQSADKKKTEEDRAAEAEANLAAAIRRIPDQD